MKTIKTKAPAWVNNKGKLIPVCLYDEIEITALHERKISIRKTSGYKIPTNHLNPVYKAATALQKLKPNKFGAEIKIRKRIPTFCGLNSQASDACAVLETLNKLWKFGLKHDELRKVAESADKNVGKIFKASSGPEQHIILIKPKHILIGKNWKGNVLSNFPDLRLILESLKNMGSNKAELNGKGPTLFVLSEKKMDASQLPESVRKKADFIWTGKTCKMSAVFSDCV